MVKSTEKKTFAEQRETFATAVSKLRTETATLGSSIAEFDEILRDEAIALESNFDALEAIAKNPVIQLATVGTTSAGKSTLLNGLIGARIAPMDAGEMSAGMLTLIHHPEDEWIAKKVGHESEYAKGQDAVYDKLQKYMHEVIKRREEVDGIVECADFQVRGPLVVRDQLQSVPEGVEFRLFDLPGLRTVDDPHNKALIVDRLKEALSLVILDRTQLFDKEKKDKLLGEVKDIVEDLGDSRMSIFILNKADVANPGGVSLEDTVASLRRELANKLNLDEVHLIPFSGLSLLSVTELLAATTAADVERFAAVCRSDEFQKTVRPKVTKYVRELEGEDRAGARSVVRVLDDIDYGEPVEAKAMVALTVLIAKATSVTALFEEIDARLDEYAAEVVFYPVVKPQAPGIAGVLDRMNAFLAAGKIDQLDELQRQKDAIQEARFRVAQLVNAESDRHGGFVESLSATLDSVHGHRAGTAFKDLLLSEVELELVPKLIDLPLLVSETKQFAVSSIALVVTNALVQNTDTLTLTESLVARGSGHGEAREISRAVHALRESGYTKEMAAAGGKLTSHGSSLSLAQMERAKQFERARAVLYGSVRASLAKVVESQLRVKLHQILPEVAALFRELAQQTWSKVEATVQPLGVSALDTAPSSFVSVAVQVEVPEEVVTVGYLERSAENIATKSVRKEGSCFETQRIVETQTAVFAFPSAAEMHDDWEDGIQTAHEELASLLGKWLKRTCLATIKQLHTEIKKFVDAASRGLEAREKLLQGETATVQARLAEVQLQVANCQSLVSNVRAIAGFRTSE